jgi:cold shock CspA family protein
MVMENGYAVGIVLLYNRLKGFGFVAPLDEDVPDIFVHSSNIIADKDDQYLVRGQKVCFKVSTNPRTGKTMAVNVIKLVDPIVDPALLALGTPKNGGQRER